MAKGRPIYLDGYYEDISKYIQPGKEWELMQSTSPEDNAVGGPKSLLFAELFKRQKSFIKYPEEIAEEAVKKVEAEKIKEIKDEVIYDGFVNYIKNPTSSNNEKSFFTKINKKETWMALVIVVVIILGFYFFFKNPKK